MYVKVYGTIRVFNKEKAIVGTHIKKLDKLDDVTNHLLQVFVAHAIRKKGVLTNRDLHGAAVVGGQGARQTGQPMFGGAAGAMAGSGDPKSLVLAVMKEITKTNKFIHKADVFAHLQHQINKKDFDHALNVLCDNGAIYSTYDNDIYSITD
jgi:hypothetical protein